MSTTWDPAHTDAGWTLSNGNKTLTATTAANLYSVSSTRKTIASGGRFYMEFSFSGIAGSGGCAIALADSTYSVPGPINTNQAFVYVNNNFISCWNSNSSDVTWNGTCTVDIAVDLTSSPHRYYERTNGGAWHNVGNPAAFTGGSTPGAAESVDLRMAISSANNGNVCTMEPGSGTFARAVPSGFVGWDAPILPTLSRSLIIG